MGFTRYHGNHGFARKHTALRHQNWDMAIDSAVVAEFAVGVGAPSRDSAV